MFIKITLMENLDLIKINKMTMFLKQYRLILNHFFRRRLLILVIGSIKKKKKRK